MKKTLYAIICYLSIALVSSAFSGAAFAEGHGAFGLWLTDKGRSRVEIKNCEPENPAKPAFAVILFGWNSHLRPMESPCVTGAMSALNCAIARF